MSSSVRRDLHAASAAARRRFHQEGITNLLADPERFDIGGDAAFRTRHDRGMPKLLGGALGFDLVAHQADVLRLRRR